MFRFMTSRFMIPRACPNTDSQMFLMMIDMPHTAVESANGGYTQHTLVKHSIPIQSFEKTHNPCASFSCEPSDKKGVQTSRVTEHLPFSQIQSEQGISLLSTQLPTHKFSTSLDKRDVLDTRLENICRVSWTQDWWMWSITRLVMGILAFQSGEELK